MSVATAVTAPVACMEPSPALIKEVEALSASVLGLDASRRVGWAKAFEALRRIDGLEEDLRQTRDELRWLRRCYSRLVGFIVNAGSATSDAWDTELSPHRAAEAQFRHDDAYDAGKSAAERHKAIVANRTEEQERNRRRRAAAFRHVALSLARGAARAGHIVRANDTEVRCACGASLATPSHRAARNWKLEHLCLTATGEQWEELWPRERDAFLERGDA